MKKTFIFVITSIVLVSCTTQSLSPLATPSAPVFNGYTINTSSSYVNNPSVIISQTLITGNLQNDKFFSESEEFFNQGVSQGVTTSQNYFYVNNLLDYHITDTGIVYYFYDASGQLIGATKGNLYERYIYNANNIVYCEKINLPYNNPNAQVYSRRILQFDANGEVITAGKDANFDGIMEDINYFTYSNDDLMSISYYDGTIQTFDYTNVIDNFNIITENSYGKKVLRLTCADSFCNLNYYLNFSKHILTQNFPLANYQVLPTTYYATKIETQFYNNPNLLYQGVTTTTTQFYFN
ncbi:hypothetical protein OX283_003735 [Flavobacterium sp. SUN052]|uniref:hypothetical protein n=1 Tax=Flavobacterium sp. SUN052 TaxID=3002441 RepID=UPI00237EAC45|nr:hypothetical protein [Flavobacterium sp. SUN052]MEC4003755.1 hypothetical protein [Flavobacterium sp. SUN052]